MTRHARWLLATAGLVLAVAGGIPSHGAEGDEPPYPHGDFTGDCTQCHQSDRWVPAKPGPDFKHAPGFPLTGAHRTARCRDCHLSLDFGKTPAACADCHKDPHLGELGTDCARCHTPRNFIDRSRQLDSHRATRFPLTGAHVTVECESCHVPQPQGALKWVNTPVDCQACHIALYDATTDPNHAAAQFPKDCALCHTPTSWQRSRFNHDVTGFPLTGAHRAQPCSSCHANGYIGTPTACVACHQADYNGTTDPNHAAAGFPTDCSQCHNTTSWGGAKFDHAATGFPLTGAHQTVLCSSCHANGYSGTPTACVACHQADYNGTTNPSHVGSGFSTDCTLCHTTVSFQGPFTQHDAKYFPIYSGKHAGRWSSCNDCHTNPSDYRTFSCFLCHSAADTTPRHSGVPGYAYDSTACYSCHRSP